MANNRGYEEWDEIIYGDWSDTYGGMHDGQTGDNPSEWDDVDWVKVGFVYPDGWTEFRTFVGPWDDYEDFYGDLEEWWESDGTP